MLGALGDGVPGWADAARRVRAEHADLRRRAGALLDGTSAGPLAAHELGARLHDHVRFEERELFVLLEHELPDEALVALGEAIGTAEAGRSASGRPRRQALAQATHVRAGTTSVPSSRANACARSAPAALASATASGAAASSAAESMRERSRCVVHMSRRRGTRSRSRAARRGAR